MIGRRVVVTGLGTVCPVGNTVDAAWEAILNGKSGVTRIWQFDPSEFNTQICASVIDFDPSQVMTPKETRRFAEFVQFAGEASRQAIEDANLDITEANQGRVGVAIGAGMGGLGWIQANHRSLEAGGPRKVSPFFIPGAIINMAPGFVAMRNKLRGPNISIVTACTTGTHNIGMAARLIASGDADVMLAGGTEMATNALSIAGFSAARALSSKYNDTPERASRPWDKDRDGFVLGDGAATLVLEEYEHAKKRGATIYAELAGFGMSDDAYHMTAPDPEGSGFVSVMETAIRDAGLDKTDIDYVNAHGTSTPMLDPLEAQAVKAVFGDHATQLAVSSTKSMTGHLLGAAGAIEALFSVLAIRDQVAPPTINLDNPEESCGDLNLVPHQAQPRVINAALSNSFGFGGTNGTLVFKKMD